MNGEGCAYRRVDLKLCTPNFLVVRGSVFRPEILVFCRSRDAGSSGVVRVLKLRAYLHKIEGLSHGSLGARGYAWGHVEVPWRMIFLGFVD